MPMPAIVRTSKVTKEAELGVQAMAISQTTQKARAAKARARGPPDRAATSSVHRKGQA